MSALKSNATVDVYLYISKVYVKLDQPLNSIGKLKEGNEKFPFEPSLLQAIARIYEVGYLQSIFSLVFVRYWVWYWMFTQPEHKYPKIIIPKYLKITILTV